MSGLLYQLSYSRRRIGATVYVDGPFDEWGYVIKEQRVDDEKPGNYYYLIRGTGNKER